MRCRAACRCGWGLVFGGQTAHPGDFMRPIVPRDLFIRSLAAVFPPSSVRDVRRNSRVWCALELDAQGTCPWSSSMAHKRCPFPSSMASSKIEAEKISIIRTVNSNRTKTVCMVRTSRQVPASLFLWWCLRLLYIMDEQWRSCFVTVFVGAGT